MTKQITKNVEVTPSQVEEYLNLLEQAHIAKENAYCEYSGFKVGAALLLKNGEKVFGCNVENASYGLTMCAERTAIFKAVSEGAKPGDIEAIAIAASGKNFSPCGACRQVIHEFGMDTVVIFEFDGKVIISSARQLMPYGYVETE